MNNKIDIHRTDSDRKGLPGLVEGLFRKYNTLGFLVVAFIIATFYIFCISVSAFPTVFMFQYIVRNFSNSSGILLTALLSLSLGLGFLLFIFIMLFSVAFCNFIFPLKMRPFKDINYSLDTIAWYIHNALVQLARYTVLDFITPTPLNILFYRMMGMKIGRGVQINSSNISDPALITLGDYVTIGGSATIFAHYGQKGYLVVGKTQIKSRTTIGLKATVMGDVIVGEGCLIKAHNVLLPKTRVPDNTTL